MLIKYVSGCIGIKSVIFHIESNSRHRKSRLLAHMVCLIYILSQLVRKLHMYGFTLSARLVSSVRFIMTVFIIVLVASVLRHPNGRQVMCSVFISVVF